MNKIYLLFYFVIISLVSPGQISEGGLPYSFKNLSAFKIDEFIIDPPNDSIINELSEKSSSIYYVGSKILTSINPSSNGTWINNEDGSRSWLIKITSAKAIGLALNYKSFKIPKGAELFLYNENRNHVIGKFTSKRNEINPITHTQIIEGSTTIIEYHEPPNCNQLFDFEIESIAYYFRGFDDYLAPYKKNSNNSRAEFCQIDVACSEGDNWTEQIDAVVHFTLYFNGGYGVCSASVINNTNQDCSPYILTAWHCGEHTANQNLNGYTWYWNYQKSSCQPNNNGSDPSKGNQTMINGAVKSTSGSGTLNNPPSNSSQLAGSDFTLVELASNIPESYGAYYAGWDNSNSLVSSGVSIHHPNGSAKKISTFNSNLQSYNYNGGADNAHWVVTWVATANGHGVTEGGSSGSPIFDQNGRIVGQLSGGSSYCYSPNDADLYGKFSSNWTENGPNSASQLEPWLDPAGLNVSTLDGTYAPCNSFTCSATTSNNSVVEGNNVDFNGVSSDPNVTWSWDFDVSGIGGVSPSTSNTQNPSNIIFSNEGVYNITLTVSNGSQNCTSNLQITVSAPVSEPCEASGNSNCSPNNQNEYISIVSLEEINNNTGCSAYSDYSNLSTSLVSGNTYTIELQTAITGSSNLYYDGDEVAVWIDYNNNFIYEDDQERVGYKLITSNWNNTFEFTVPEDIYEGQVNMRCRISYNGNGDGSAPINPCGSSVWGEVEDYTIILVAENDPCSNTPIINPISDLTVCENFTFPAISGSDLSGSQAYYTGSGGTGTQYNIGDVYTTVSSVTLYAYDAINGCDDEESFTLTIDSPQTSDISGLSNPILGTQSEYLVSSNAGSTYNWNVVNGNIINGQGTNTILVQWNNEGNGQISVIESSNFGCQGNQVTLSINVIDNGGSYCQASGNSDCSPQYGNSYIYNVSLEEINNNSPCSEYSDFTNLSATLVANNTYTISVATLVAGTTSSFYPGDELAVWIDYNNNFSYEDEGERVGYVLINNSWNNTFQFTVPDDISEGQVNMRCRISFNGDGNGAAPIEPCGSSVWGEVEDYTINLVAENDPCINPPNINPISDLTVCGETFTFPAITGTDLTGSEAYYTGVGGTGTQYNIGDIYTTDGSITIYTYDGSSSCYSEESFTLTLVSTNFTLASTPTTCGQANGEIEVTVSSGQSPYSYSVDNGVNVPPPSNNTGNFSGLPYGNYTVSVTDENGCQGISIIEVMPSTYPVFVSINPQSTTCGQDNGELEITASSGEPEYTFSINNGIDAPPSSNETGFFSNLPSGNYNITLEDTQGCILEGSTTIGFSDALSVTLNSNSPSSCQINDGSVIAEVSGGSGSYIYQWSNGATTQEIYNLSYGDYSLTVTDEDGCTISENVEIALIDLPELTTTTQDISCYNGADGFATVSVSGGTSPFNFQWSNGQDSPTIANLIAGEYTITVMDDNGCSVSEIVNIISPDEITFDYTVTNLACLGSSTGSLIGNVYGGTPPYNYQWSNGETTSNINFLTVGNYYLTIVDANNCQQNMEFTVSSLSDGPQTSSIIGLTQVSPLTTHQYSVSENMNSTYNWNTVNGAIISGQGSNIVLVQWVSTGVGQLNVVETDENGCDGDTVTVAVSIGNTGILTNKTNDIVKIYPNPTNGIVNIEIENYHGTVFAKVYDLIGNLIVSSDTKIINTQYFSRGVYLLEVSFGTTVREIKLIRN